jgi:hypothetical protein
MGKKTNPDGWTIPAELPPAFELPQHFRQSLPTEVQEWLDSVEKRIDGLTLKRIQKEAFKLYDEKGPNITEGSLDDDDLYRFGRRLFYVRMQQILNIMFPGQGVEVGVDLLWMQDKNTVPGGAVSEAVIDGENINSVDLSGAGVEAD